MFVWRRCKISCEVSWPGQSSCEGKRWHLGSLKLLKYLKLLKLLSKLFRKRYLDSLKLLKHLKHLKLIVCILFYCHTPRISSGTDPFQISKIPKQTILSQDLNTQKINKQTMLSQDLIPKQMILSRDLNTQQIIQTNDPLSGSKTTHRKIINTWSWKENILKTPNLFHFFIV